MIILLSLIMERVSKFILYIINLYIYFNMKIDDTNKKIDELNQKIEELKKKLV